MEGIGGENILEVIKDHTESHPPPDFDPDESDYESVDEEEVRGQIPLEKSEKLEVDSTEADQHNISLGPGY